MKNSKKAIFIYVLVSLFLCFEMAVQVAPGVMTPQLMRDLHIDAFSLGLMSGFYFVTYTLMQVPAGLLFDRFNVRWVIVLPLLICSTGTLLFGMAEHVMVAAAARLLMGVGSAFAFIAVLVVAADLFPKRHFALLTGITQMLAAFGAIGGAIPLANMIEALGWRTTMHVFAIIGFLLALMIWSWVRYNRIQSIDHEMHDISMLTSFRAVTQSSQTWWVALYACLLWAPMAGFASLWGVPFLMQVYSLDKATAAGLCSLMWLGIALFSPLLGWASTAMGRRTLPLALSALLGAMSFAVVLFLGNTPVGVLGAALLLAGAACAGQALSFSVVQENNLVSYQATAIAFNNMAVVIAGLIFQPLMGKLLQLFWQGEVVDGLPVYSAYAYRVSGAVVFAAFLAGAFVAYRYIRETYCQEKTP